MEPGSAFPKKPYPGSAKASVLKICSRLLLMWRAPTLFGRLAYPVFGAAVTGVRAKLLDEVDVAPGEPLVVISATGQTQAAVDIALEFTRRYPENPLIAIASEQQAREGAPKHSSGKTLYHAIREAKRGFFLDNGMPMGDVSTTVIGQTGTYNVCPLSSIGAVTGPC
jgi:uncharacterized phosphosugar-binding protein